VTSLVLDTTALSHFARAGRIDELRIAINGDEPFLVAEVRQNWPEAFPATHRSGA
jgi:hypothetical protein